MVRVLVLILSVQLIRSFTTCILLNYLVATLFLLIFQEKSRKNLVLE
jgi:hypothetical protein